MAAPYASVTISGYNSNPPADDGSAVSTNQITWANNKSKLSDPIKTRTDSMDSALVAAFGKIIGGAGITSTGVGYTVQLSDQGKLVNATASSITITTPDATSVLSPFVFAVKNSSTGSVVLDGNGSQTVDGIASIVIGAGSSGLVFTDGSNWFTVGEFSSVINLLQEDTSPDVSNDFVPSYDTSATVGKKIKLSNLPANLPRGYIDGLTLSQNSTTSLAIAAGKCRDSADSVNMSLSAITKTTSSWAVGSGQGGLDTGAIASGTWYYTFVIQKSSDGTTDALFSLSPSAPTMPSGYDKKRYIGAFQTDGSSHVPTIIQHGDWFTFPTIVVSAVNNSAVPDSSSHLVSMNVPLQAPVKAVVRVHATSAINLCVYDPAKTDETASASTGNVPTAAQGASIEVWTNSSGQIKYQASSATGNLYIATAGYMDQRGKNA